MTGIITTRLWCCSARRRATEAAWTLGRAATHQGLVLIGKPEFFEERERRGNHIGPARRFARQRYVRRAVA